MLKNKNIICISTIDWDFIWQGHQEIMSVLAKNGNRVLFIENTGVRAPTFKDIPRLWHRLSNWRKGFKGVRKEMENLYIYSPLAIPLPYSRVAIKINRVIMLSVIRRWMNVMEFHNPVVWTFLPTGIVLDIINELEPAIFIYYCIDDFASSSKMARRIRKIEEKIVKRADLVFATSHNLYNRCLSINSQTHLFPFGINIANYTAARESSRNMPDDLRRVKKPIIGYIGGIHKWIDMKLIRNIALARKDLSIVMVGPKQSDLSDIENLDNVFMLGKKEYHELPAYAKFFDAGIIPYQITKYTENVYPTKINEYLAMGKPVISTKIPEMIEFDKANGGDFIYFIENGNDIGSPINRALSENNKDIINRRIEVAKSNSWDRKIGAMCDLVERKSEEIQMRINQSWVERFKYVYSKVRRRAIKILGIAALLYLTIFYTPIVWLVASPLNMVGAPDKADCIVVFGGGVGESGKAGQGYEERVSWAIELYKRGFADHIIFSSGYKSVFDETTVMKAITIAMGVPEGSIIMDKRPSNTYENVKFTALILRSKGWKHILLVTSPYHTLRASLVFDKIASDLTVTYAPLPKSQFYQHETKGMFNKRVTVKQIKGIFHEYLGIVYYKFKGWI